MRQIAIFITVIMTSAMALSFFVLEARSIEPQASCKTADAQAKSFSVCTDDIKYILLN